MIVRKLARGLPLLMILAPGAVWSLGLGDITVNTALNQPLRADIRVLSATPGDIENMRVSLAPQQAFDRVGIERVFALTQLDFNVVPANDGAVIEVTTKQPVREPFLNFLIEMQWANGRLLREYTVLLDPPVLMDDRGVISNALVMPAEAGRAQPAMSSESAVDSAAGSPSSARAGAASSQRAPASHTPASHTVVSGDTLGEIAQRYRPDENIELSRMMVAIYRANPETFAQGNINDLKTGMILRMPDPQEIAAVGSEAAIAEVARQNAVWSQSRDRLAAESAVAESAAQPGGRPAERPSADTMATETGDSPARANDRPARLKIMAADQDATADAADAEGATAEPRTRNAAENEALLVRELAESRRVEIDSLQTKVAELESMIVKQERIIRLQSEALAALQERLDADAAVAEAQPSADDGAPQSESVTQSAPANLQANASPADDAQAQAVAKADSPAQSPRDKADSSPPASNTLDDMLASPITLASAGAAALLLLALIWLVVKRAASRRTETIDLATYVDNAGDNESDAEVATHRPAAPAKNDAVVGSHSIAESATAPTPISKAAANADPQATQHAAKPVNDDTLAEADVYIAYGLHQQGEDLLKEAIKRNPERVDYRLKLLEVYYAGKNHAAFDAEAKALYDLLGGTRDANWEQVVAMGMELNPRNPLFAGTSVRAGEAASAPPAVTGDQAAEAGLEQGGTMAAAKRSPDRANAPQAVRADNAEMDSPHDDLTDSGNDTSSPDASLTAYNSKMLEFDMGEPGETVKAGASSDASAGHEEGLNLDLSGLGTADVSAESFDLNQTPDDLPAEADAHEDLPSHSASLIGLDVGNFDDTSFSIELGAGEPEADRAEVSGDDASAQDLNLDDMADLSDINEVGTKLDLAKAYLDMGDSDGAMSTLEEVLQEGDEEQRKEAETLMRQIA
ncbi:MAG: FimV/HubP family polar landmark protein [Gammaproteobacteria bacterium]